MKKSIKCGIAATVVMAAGFAAYQTYGAYGAQDNSLLMQNIEALAGNADGAGDASGDGGANKPCKRGEINNFALLLDEPKTVEVTSKKSGTISIPVTKGYGDGVDTLMTYSGSFESDKTYKVAYAALRCQKSTGNCCKVKDQEIISCKLK